MKRFVLLSASPFERGGPSLGQVHDYLAELGEKGGKEEGGKGIEWAVLRPTWFMGMFFLYIVYFISLLYNL